MLGNLRTTCLVAAASILVVSGLAAAGQEVLADSQIATAIESEYLRDGSVPFHRVDIHCSDGIVTLSGTVLNLLERQRAAEVAMAVKGVRSVVNQITVAPVPRTDSVIRRNVEEALFMDPAADAAELDVRVVDGVVTLRGEVGSRAEREIALDVARGVRGVREVRAQVAIALDERRPDSELQAEIERRLELDARVDAGLIDVTVNNGRVSLLGVVGSAAERAQAYRDAWIRGVVAVETDSLAVEWWARDERVRKLPPVLADDEIASAVRDAFRYDPRVWSWNPTVEVDDGVVTLTGEVTDVQARRAAEEDARQTVGVWRVRNDLKVRPLDPASDRELEAQVRTAFYRDPYVNRVDLAVDVINGVLYLSGRVGSVWEKSRAEDVAARVSGVLDIVNNTDVQPMVPKSDWELAEDVRFHLQWNPRVDTTGITVEVEDGIVTLEGTVETWYAKTAATKEAYEAGASTVRNRLAVEA